MNEKTSSNSSTWTLNLIDPGDESGDAVLPLPADLLEQLGWQEGDMLHISQTNQGTISLIKRT